MKFGNPNKPGIKDFESIVTFEKFREKSLRVIVFFAEKETGYVYVDDIWECDLDTKIPSWVSKELARLVDEKNMFVDAKFADVDTGKARNTQTKIEKIISFVMEN